MEEQQQEPTANVDQIRAKALKIAKLVKSKDIVVRRYARDLPED